MVNIDAVYQTVLALANKEQRGYITPQEFNLFANQAQQSIFEQYFYDLNQFKRVPGNQSNHADMTSIIEEKIAIFNRRTLLLQLAGGVSFSTFALPNDFYRFINIQADYSANFGNTYVDLAKGQRVVEIMSIAKANELLHSGPLVRPTANRPIAYLQRTAGAALEQPSALIVYPEVPRLRADYVVRPDQVQWGYIVVNEKAIWNPGESENFQLHESEQKNLVIKILKLAGVSIEDAGLVQVATQEEIKSIRQEKA